MALEKWILGEMVLGETISWRNGSLWGVELGVRKLTSQRDTIMELFSFLLMAFVFFFLACVTFIKFSKIWLKDLKRVMAKGVQDQRCVCKTEVIRAEKGLWPVGTHLL